MLIQNKKTNFFIEHKESFMSLLVAIFCLLLIYLFPASNSAQKYTSALFFFFIVPALFIKFILKKDLSAFGFNLENKKDGLIWGAGMLIASLVIGYLLIHYTDFTNNYRIPAAAISNFWAFVSYELILVNIMLFFQSFFFMGFILFSLSKKLEYTAAVIPVLFFLLFTILFGGFNWRLAPFLIILTTGSVASYKNKSFIYVYVASLLFMFFLDAYLISMLK